MWGNLLACLYLICLWFLCSVSFECFGIWENVKSSFHCSDLVFFSAYVLSDTVERLIFLSDWIIVSPRFVYFENVILLETILQVNLDFKVPHNSTDLYIVKLLLWKFSNIQKIWKNFVVSSPTQHLDSAVFYFIVSFYLSITALKCCL